jgi:hypothetical protein
MKAFPYILNPAKSLTVFIEGKQSTIRKEDPSFENAIAAVKENRWEDLKLIVDKLSAIKVFVKGDLKVEGSTITYRGEVVHNLIVDRILQFIQEGLEVEPMLNFLNKLMKNSSYKCIQDLFAFLERGNMPIDPDGDFYAYKAVRSDWTDKHTGTISNTVGTTVSFARNKVDDNPANGCSYGLHAGSIQYVKSFASCSDKIIVVKIDPSEVVSVPNEDTSKLRCCRYKVVEEYIGLLPDTLYDSEKHYDDDYDDGDEEDYERCDDGTCWNCGAETADCGYTYCPECGEML